MVSVWGIAVPGRSLLGSCITDVRVTDRGRACCCTHSVSLLSPRHVKVPLSRKSGSSPVNRILDIDTSHGSQNKILKSLVPASIPSGFSDPVNSCMGTHFGIICWPWHWYRCRIAGLLHGQMELPRQIEDPQQLVFLYE